MASLARNVIFLAFCFTFCVCKDKVDPCFWPFVNNYGSTYTNPSAWVTNCTNVCTDFTDYVGCLQETCNLGSLKASERVTLKTAAVERLMKDCNYTCSSFNSTFPADCGTNFKVNVSFFVGVGVVGLLLLATVFYFVIAKIRGQ